MPRAVMCEKTGPINEGVRLVEVPKRDPRKGQALVKVLSANIAFGETLVLQGKHFYQKDPPYVLGGSICGRVIQAGPECPLAPGTVVFGPAVNGGLQEEALVDSRNVYTVPAPNQALDPRVLPALPGIYGTSYHALKEVAKLRPGERLCVLGAAGGIGLAGVELGKAMGAIVVACASSAEKLQACKEAGADVCVDYSLPGFKDRIRKEAGGPLDVVYDPVGGEYAEPALRALGFGGRFLVCGFAAGGEDPPSAIPKIPLNLALLNERQILGVQYPQWAGDNPDLDKKNMAEMLGMMANGKLKPRTPMEFPLENWAKAIDVLQSRRAIGPICLTPNDEKNSKL